MLQNCCQILDRRCLEQGRQRQVLAKFLADPAKHPHGVQGMAAKREEIIGPADILDPQNLTPDCGHAGHDRVSDSAATAGGPLLGSGHRARTLGHGQTHQIKRHR